MSWRETNHDKFDRYVMNEIPIRLIRLSDMTFVGRNDVRKHFWSSVPEGTASYHAPHHVKYAILSHRWLDEGEPTYEEMKAGNAGGLGYEKLESYCEKARGYETEFAWSDTCCIDKSSSTELDESIRSMFRWYKNSTICIIHLAESVTIGDILHDEWMKRGWTLQELLASDNIKLFNKHWMPMTRDKSDKSWPPTEVMKTLQRATGIPVDELCDLLPGPFRVDERMTWAARRKTTRVEDVAYSLMGMFDVSLQIAYGEGGDRAFCRLIEAIMHAGNPSVLNWKGEAAKHHFSDAIPRSPESFVGSQGLKFGGGRLEMTMTSLGLRVTLVMLPLTFRSEEFLGVSDVRITLDCPLCPTIETDIATDHDSILRQAHIYEYALGIVNYSLIIGGSHEVLGVRGKSAGVILSRFRVCSIPGWTCATRRNDLVGLKCVSGPEKEFGQWTLVHGVGLVQVDFPNTPSQSIICIDREYLQTVYL
ncbi:hypothetical protein DFH29DRAFT_406908 [Suillus ampliporus]|nr:hypothetical protein DFH29DRAFT_406908 [Suillus ampliporus]